AAGVRPVISSRACAGGSGAAPATAPRPTMTTSVFFRSTAMAHSSPVRYLQEHVVVICRPLGRLLLGAHALLIRPHGEPDTGVADQIPTDEVRISAVIGIAECTLDGVRSEQVEERRRVWREARGGVFFHVAQDAVLVLRREV